MLPKIIKKNKKNENKKDLSYLIQNTSLPYSIIESVITKANPELLYNLSKTCKYFCQWIYRIRGLTVDTLVLIKNDTQSKFFNKFSSSKIPKIFYSESANNNQYKAAGVVLLCNINDIKCLRLLKNVTVYKSVILYEIDANEFPETKLLNVKNDCELVTINCKLEYEAWNDLFEINWSGFECKSKRNPPATSLLIQKLPNIKRIDINLNYFAYDEMLNLCKWKQQKPIKELVIQHFYSGIQPKLLVQFFEEKLDVDSSVWINYHPAISKHEVEMFQKNLIKWMNKMGGDWAMVGHKNKKRKLLIKIGHGSENEMFEKKCRIFQ